MANYIQKKIIPRLFKRHIGKIKGIENLPRKGGVVLAANHASYLDHFIIGYAITAIDRMPYFLAKKEHFDTFFQRKWHEFLKAIPIDRDAGGKEALNLAVKNLKEEKVIVIYPEGTRTLSGKMNRGKTGAVRLAIEAEVPIVPIGITNSFKLLPKGKFIPKRKIKCDVTIGKPIYFDKYFKKNISHDDLILITNKLMKEIAKLAKTTYNF